MKEWRDRQDMMSLEEFTEDILKEIRVRADGAFQIRRHDVTKNNNIKLAGIAVINEGADIGPCIYLNEFFREYESGGMKFDEIVDEVYKLVMEHKDDDVSGVDLSGFQNWETVRGMVYAKLVNAKENMKLDFQFYHLEAMMNASPARMQTTIPRQVTMTISAT